MTFPEVSLGSLLREPLRNGKSASTSKDGKGVRVFSISAVTHADFSEENTKPSVLPPEDAEGVWAEPGDIFVQRSNTPELVGTAARYTGPSRFAVFPDLLIRVRPADRLDGRFLTFFLRSTRVRRYFQQEARGISGSMPKISQPTIEALLVPVPSLKEQNRIVAAIETHFSRLDAAVASLTRAKANVKRARASVLKAAVEGRLVPTEAEIARAEGREYEPASVLLERILVERKAAWAAGGGRGKYVEPVKPETEGLAGLPEGWCWVNVDALLREPLRNGKSAQASHDGSGIRTLTLTAVTTGQFTNENTKLTIATPDQVEGLWLEASDLLVQRANTPELVGTAALYRGTRDWAVFPDLLIRVRTTARVSVEFVTIAMAAPALRRFFRENAKGIAGSMPKIGQNTIQAAPIPLPPPAEQHRITVEVDRRLSVLDALDATLDTNLARCARLRQSILKRAFEGRLVPASEPQDPPAGSRP